MNGLFNILVEGSYILLVIAIAFAGNDETHDCLYVMVAAILVCVFTFFKDIFKDGIFVGIKVSLIHSIIQLIIIGQIVLFCLDLGWRHNYSYTVALLPTLEVLAILTLGSLLLVPIVNCFWIPKLKEFAIN